MCKFYSRNNIGKHISGIIFSVNLLQLNVILIKNLLNKVKPDIDMLRPYMMYLVLAK